MLFDNARALVVCVWLTGCGGPEEPRLVAELPGGVTLDQVVGFELDLARGRCGSGEIVWSSGSRVGEETDRPPLLESGDYSASARLLDGDCLTIAEGCVETSLPVDASELVVPTVSVETASPACAPWLCSSGLCTRNACALDVDADTVALFDMEGAATGTITDAAIGLEVNFESAPTEAPGIENCGVAAVGSGTAVAFVAGTSALTLTEGSIDLFAWFPAELPTNEGGVGLLYRETDPQGDLSPFGLQWLGDGRLVALTGRSSNGIPDRGICSNSPMPTERWVHLGINLGAPGVEFWVDGVQQVESPTARFDDGGQPGVCVDAGPSTPLPAGDAAWVLFGRPRFSGDEVVGHYTFYGRIDQLRFSSRRRNFASFVGIVP